MTTVTVSTRDIADLRARTGAGMMDCKRALEEAAGDMEKAVEVLRKKGIARAEKRAGRSATQGVIAIELAPAGDAAGMIELTCETDFVARTDDFRALAAALAHHVAGQAEPGVNAGDVGGQPLAGAPGTSVGERVREVSGKTGEAMALARWARLAVPGGTVGSYLHHNGQVGVLVQVEGGNDPAARDFARDVALHIAFADPIGVRPEDIPADTIARERRIAEEQAALEGKPEAIRGKIVEGKVRKFIAERTLLEQPFVRDETVTVGELARRAGPALRVARFARFQVGAA